MESTSFRYVETAATWKDAELHCSNEGAHLLTLHSIAEDALVRGFWLRHLTDMFLWLGFRDSNVSS